MSFYTWFLWIGSNNVHTTRCSCILNSFYPNPVVTELENALEYSGRSVKAQVSEPYPQSFWLRRSGRGAQESAFLTSSQAMLLEWGTHFETTALDSSSSSPTPPTLDLLQKRCGMLGNAVPSGFGACFSVVPLSCSSHPHISFSSLVLSFGCTLESRGSFNKTSEPALHLPSPDLIGLGCGLGMETLTFTQVVARGGHDHGWESINNELHPKIIAGWISSFTGDCKMVVYLILPSFFWRDF